MTKLKYFYCPKCQVLMLETEVKSSVFTEGLLVHSFEISKHLIVEHGVIEEP